MFIVRAQRAAFSSCAPEIRRQMSSMPFSSPFSSPALLSPLHMPKPPENGCRFAAAVRVCQRGQAYAVARPPVEPPYRPGRPAHARDTLRHFTYNARSPTGHCPGMPNTFQANMPLCRFICHHISHCPPSLLPCRPYAASHTHTVQPETPSAFLRHRHSPFIENGSPLNAHAEE